MGLLDVKAGRRRMPCLEGLEDRNLLSTAGMMGLSAEVQKTPASHLVTVRAHATGTFVVVPVSQTPKVYNMTLTGQGTAPGFGVVTASAHDLLTITSARRHQMAALSNGTGTLSDAAGDQLFFTFSASGPFVSASKFHAKGTGTITGGTGILTGATGRITANATADIASGTFTVDLVVKATYPKA